MTVTMGPPPPRNAVVSGEPSTSELSSSNTAKMGPPPPKTPNQSAPESSSSINPQESSTAEPESSVIHQQLTDAEPQSSPNHQELSDAESESSKNHQELNPAETNASETVVEKEEETQSANAAAIVVPYTVPEWSGPPCHHFSLEVLKNGAIIDQIDVNKKGAYMFGRVDLCDFLLEHPTISRFHAVLQFKGNGDAFLYDLGSTHGTFVNKKEVKKRVYVDLRVGDVIRFGHSSRLYVFQGPSDLMPPEGDLKRLRNAKIQQEMQDMEASLHRAKIEASHADGISWGMDEDAVEENEDEVEEITWQTYKGQLTEKQEKTREKVIKRLGKIAHMKKEIDAIRAKDISQGGLTQGQQTQIARNEQRMSQIMEELENLEETLNESIRESLGARGGRLSNGKKKGAMEDGEEDYLSDDDEFYDRTQKLPKHKTGENKSVETADTLLDKKEALTKEIEGKEKLLLDEDKQAETSEVAEAGDALDAYMSAVSSQLVLDNKEKLRKELSSLQSELDRILYLLRIADPTGEAAKKREMEGQKPKVIVKENLASDASKRLSAEKNNKSALAAAKNQESASSSETSENIGPGDSLIPAIHDKPVSEATFESGKKQEEPESVKDETEGAVTAYTITKPQWLGAVEDKKKQEIAQEAPADMQETDQFVDYKDRVKILKTIDPSQGDLGIEEAAPGLIIRKRKKAEIPKVSEVKEPEPSTGSELKAEDAVALLLKHSRGLSVLDEEEIPATKDVPVTNKERKGRKKAKRVLGPERPSFLNDEPDNSSWVPPEGQSGDGRTSLNDRFGY